MKTLLLSALFLTFGSASFAAAPSPETSATARILINSPEITAQLRAKHIDNLRDVTSTEVKPGVTRYVLTFYRECECIPATAKATIQEDLTPTYRDGFPLYESSLEIKEGN